MNLIKVNGKYRCDSHGVECQVCKNSSTGQYFLKCPFNKKFECGTVNITSTEALNYDYYMPNYENAISDYVGKLIDKDDEKDRWA